MSSSNAAYIPYRGGWREVALPPFPFPFPVQASTSPVLDLAWPALESMTWNIYSLLKQLFEMESMTWNICSLLKQLFEKLPEVCT